MHKKRGLNQAVTTLLLVALAILALILIWFYLKPAITDFSKQAQRTECTVLRLEPASCTIIPSEEEGYYSIQLKRNPGSETIKLKTAKLHFTFSDGSTSIKEITNLPDTISQTINLEPIPFSDPDVDYNKIVGIKAAALIEYKDAIKACSFSETEVSCQVKREAIEYPSKGDKSGTVPNDCTDSSWVTLKTFYKDLFTGESVSEFFANNFNPPWETAWTLDTENDLLISNRDDKTEYQFVALEGNFILEMGMRLSNPESSFGIYLKELNPEEMHPTYPNDIIAMKWYKESTSGIQALRAYRDIYIKSPPFSLPEEKEERDVWYKRRGQFVSPPVLLPVPPTIDIDIRLTRTGDEGEIFRWEYRLPNEDNIWKTPPMAEEQFIYDFDDTKNSKGNFDSETFYRHKMGPKLSLIFDEGTSQALRYIKFQSETEGTFPCPP